MTLLEGLDRTLLLMRDHVGPSASDDDLIAALTGTGIAIVGDDASLSTHAAQCAFITAALLMARSGHAVHLVAPDLPMTLPQPPLGKGSLITSLLELGSDLLPGVLFDAEKLPTHEIDLVVLIGDTRWDGRARHAIRLGASDWAGWFTGSETTSRWCATDWPLGALAAAALAAGEAFKCAMRRLAPHALHAEIFRDIFARTTEARFDLAPDGTHKSFELQRFDFVSGGAITQAAIYVFARVPGVRGTARAIEPQTGDLSNLNRYMLLRRSHRDRAKAIDLSTMDLGSLRIEPVVSRFDAETADLILPFAPSVLVGVDDVPSRWDVQRAWPAWLGVGSTGHHLVFVSYHVSGTGCAGCAHPTHEAFDGNIPTVAFVSFWAGLLLAAMYLRHVAGDETPLPEQHISYTPIRPDSARFGAVSYNPACPLHCASIDVLRGG